MSFRRDVCKEVVSRHKMNDDGRVATWEKASGHHAVGGHLASAMPHEPALVVMSGNDRKGCGSSVAV